MSAWEPQIVQVEKIDKHPNADNLSIATVLGDYPVVIRTGTYQAGDLACYIPIDTICPLGDERFQFLSPLQKEKYEENGAVKEKVVGYKYSIETLPLHHRTIFSKKIRGVYSQGLLIPALEGLKVGDSIVEPLCLKKMEEEEEDNLPGQKKKSGNFARPPKNFNIPYYDIKALRRYLNCLQEGEEIVVMEKLNGCNASFCQDGEKLWVKSRRYYKKDDPEDLWYDAAVRYNLAQKLSRYPMLVFFAELIGKVGGFHYDCQIVNGEYETKLKFFDIWNVKQMRFLDYDQFLSITKELELETAPELYRGLWTGKENIYPLAEGKTTLGGKHCKEGIVIKSVKERFEPKLNGRLQLKLISEEFALRK